MLKAFICATLSVMFPSSFAVSVRLVSSGLEEAAGAGDGPVGCLGSSFGLSLPVSLILLLLDKFSSHAPGGTHLQMM